jgi:hypothetical protein
MVTASEIIPINASLCIWQAYDPTVKADLFSTAIVTANGLYLVDPIQLQDSALHKIRGEHSVAGIIVTNANHVRAALHFAGKFSAPILAHHESFPNGVAANFQSLGDNDRIGEELRVVSIDGAVAGEIALYHSLNCETLIVGDALINFEPYGFAFLPSKYCTNQKIMRRSLRKLLALNVERMLFAHGTPIITHAGQRLAQLLGPS